MFWTCGWNKNFPLVLLRICLYMDLRNLVFRLLDGCFGYIFINHKSYDWSKSEEKIVCKFQKMKTDFNDDDDGTEWFDGKNFCHEGAEFLDIPKRRARY